LLRGNGQLVDGDKGVTYTHKNLPLNAEDASLRSLANANQSRTKGNITVRQEPVLNNGLLSAKAT
jgi:hypothetical protein